jgi:phage terminase large subunit GpA-like protein
VTIAYDVLGAWLDAFRPPPIMLPSEFAEAYIRLPESANAIPGPLKLTRYQAGMIDSFADPKIETIVMCMSAQVGKSLAADVVVGYVIKCAPGPMLHVSPSAAKSEDYVRDRLDPLIAASPGLRNIIGGGRKGGGDSLTHKLFAGGSLNFASSFMADSLAARAIRFLVLDEIDRFAISAGTEGDPVALAIKRTRTFANRKIVLVSTPTSRIGSRIASWYERGDKRRWFVPCPECKHFDHISFERLIWKTGDAAGARLVCMECGHHANEVERRKMIELGEWRATAVGESGVASYHINELASPFSSLQSVAKQSDDAVTPEQKRTFHNVCLGETFDSSTEIELNASELQARAEPISEPYDQHIEAITCGVDVQGNRLEATYLALHRNKTASVLNHIVLNGDTSAPQVWADLDEALGATFALRDGRRLPISATGIDSGFSTDQVVSFVLSQRRKSRRVYAIKGVAGFDRPAIKEGSKIKGNMRVMLIGVDGLKLSIAKRLAMVELGPGYIRLPDHVDSEYFEQLAAEELRVKQVRGFARYEFFKTAARNEALDALVYAVAMTTLPNIVRQQTPTAPKQSVASMAARLNALSNNRSQPKDISYV